MPLIALLREQSVGGIFPRVTIYVVVKVPGMSNGIGVLSRFI